MAKTNTFNPIYYLSAVGKVIEVAICQAFVLQDSNLIMTVLIE